MYTGNPSTNPLDRIRILCTDTDNDDLMIDDSVLEFFYVSNDKNERRAAIQALRYILMQFAKMADEKVGGVYERNSDRFANFKSALDDLVKNGTVGTPYAGGISKCDIELRKCNPDSVNKSVEYGDAFNYGDNRCDDRFFNGSPNRMVIAFVDKES